MPGDVFGDVPALLGDPEPFDARAVDETTVLSVDASALFTLLQTRPAVARRWFVSLAELLGAPRTSVQRVLKSLEAAGVLELGYRRVNIADPAALLSLIND